MLCEVLAPPPTGAHTWNPWPGTQVQWSARAAETACHGPGTLM